MSVETISCCIFCNVNPWTHKRRKDVSYVAPFFHSYPSTHSRILIFSFHFLSCCRYIDFHRFLFPRSTAIDDPHKVVKVIASEGKSGDTRELSYSNCKVIGNGSFGVVFQAKLLGVPKESEDIAIKKVLQDKRFKVYNLLFLLLPHAECLASPEP